MSRPASISSPMASFKMVWQAGVALSQLDPGEGRAVEGGRLGKLLLGQAPPQSGPLHPKAELRERRGAATAW